MSYVIQQIKWKRNNNNELNRLIGEKAKKRNFKSVFKTVNWLSDNEESPNKERKNGKKLRIQVSNEFNYYQKVYKPFRLTHIHNFQDQLCINEQTIRNSQNNQSLLRTLFYIRTIHRVESNDNYVSLFLRSNQRSSNISYVAQRFDSFGDAYFHKIAGYIRLLMSALAPQKQSKIVKETQFKSSKQTISECAELDIFLESIKGKPYFLKYLPNHYVFSRELLTLIGKNIEDFCLECIQHRAIMDDIFISQNYRFLLDKNFQFIFNFLEMKKGKMTLQDLMKSTQTEYIDFLRGSKGQKIKVKVKAFMPSPHIYCMLIEDHIFSQTWPVENSQLDKSKKQLYLSEQFAKNSEILKKLTPLESKTTIDDQNRRCSYITKPRRKAKKIEYDYEI